MFIARAIFHPAPGRGPQLGEALVDISQGEQPIIVAQRLAGPNAYVVNRAFDDLMAYQTWLTLPNNVPPGKLDGLIAGPPELELWETSFTAPTGPRNAFTVRFTYKPAQGCAPEVQSALEQRIAQRNSAGGRASVWQIVAGGGPLVIALVAGFADMAMLEKMRAKTLADPATHAFAKELSPLLARPLQAPQLFRILSPAP